MRLDGQLTVDPEDLPGWLGFLRLTDPFTVEHHSTHASGECHNCGESKPTRPLALADDNGQPAAADICADCQEQFVDTRIRQYQERQRQAEAEDGEGEDVPEEIVEELEDNAEGDAPD